MNERLVLILTILRAAPPPGWMYGLDILDQAPDVGRLHPGSLYVLLGSLEDHGHVESRLQDATEHKDTRRPKRRLYRITDRGRGRLLHEEGKPMPVPSTIVPA